MNSNPPKNVVSRAYGPCSASRDRPVQSVRPADGSIMRASIFFRLMMGYLFLLVLATSMSVYSIVQLGRVRDVTYSITTEDNELLDLHKNLADALLKEVENEKKFFVLHDQTQLKHLQGDETDLDASSNGDCSAARLLSTIPVSTDDTHRPFHVGLVALDPQTGEILALTEEPSGDSVGLAPHPPGSLLTPFIYLTAFSRGMSPSTMVWDVPTNLPEDLSELAISSDEFHGPVNIRTALANDYLAPAVQVLNQVGPENVWQTTHPFGLSSHTVADFQEAANSYPLLTRYEPLSRERQRSCPANLSRMGQNH